MRMFKPSPGECVDRQTILELKMKYASQPDTPVRYVEAVKGELDPMIREDKVLRTRLENASKVNIQPFLEEHEMIQEYMENTWFPDIGNNAKKQNEFDSLYDELMEINNRIWKLEDQARVLQRGPDKLEVRIAVQARDCLFDINNLNDERAKLVRKINSIWNINVIEKLHYV
jgi:hypothetical protein